jgi:hypothetical protein
MDDDPFLRFLSGYLNQDVDVIFGDAEAAVVDFALSDPADVAAARAGVAQLLADHPDDASLLDKAASLGCDWLPEGPGEFRAILDFALEAWSAPGAVSPIRSA